MSEGGAKVGKRGLLSGLGGGEVQKMDLFTGNEVKIHSFSKRRSFFGIFGENKGPWPPTPSDNGPALSRKHRVQTSERHVENTPQNMLIFPAISPGPVLLKIHGYHDAALYFNEN